MDKVEAIKILKDFHDESAIFSVRTALETLHPELKKSEDERISKKIKNVLNWYRKSFSEKSLRNEEYDEMFAWLEKQVQPKPSMQNGITINGVEYELIEDNEADECTRCVLNDLCNTFKYDALCNTIFGSDIAVSRRFKKKTL